MRLELAAGTGSLQGSVAIDLPAEQGSGCPPLRKRYTIAEVAEGPGTRVLHGLGRQRVDASRCGGAAPSCRAFSRGGRAGPSSRSPRASRAPTGCARLTRLAGEVRLRRGEATADAEEAVAASGRAAPAAGSAGAAASEPAGAGRHVGHFALILGANVVGLGLLYGVNKVGEGQRHERGRHLLAPGLHRRRHDQRALLLRGEHRVRRLLRDDGVRRTPERAVRRQDAVPCQSGLSCNSGVCQDRDGRCPY